MCEKAASHASEQIHSNMGRTDRIDLKPHLYSDLKSIYVSFCLRFGIFEGVLAVLALSIFTVDIILLSSFLLIDLAEEKSMSLHSLYSTSFTEQR